MPGACRPLRTRYFHFFESICVVVSGIFSASVYTLLVFIGCCVGNDAIEISLMYRVDVLSHSFPSLQSNSPPRAEDIEQVLPKSYFLVDLRCTKREV